MESSRWREMDSAASCNGNGERRDTTRSAKRRENPHQQPTSGSYDVNGTNDTAQAKSRRGHRRKQLEKTKRSHPDEQPPQ